MTFAASIAEFAATATPDQLDPSTVVRVTQHLVDSVACALGTDHEPLAAVVGGYVRSVGLRPAPLIVAASDAEAGPATFANTAAIRMLDFNDTFPESHPSDLIGSLIAHSLLAEASGADLLCAMAVGYESFVAVEGSTDLRRRGWDQGVVVAIGVAAALGNLYRLSVAEIRNAVAIAATSCHATRVSRAGALSHWKSLSTAFAAMQSGSALNLARAGIHGPELPFEGRDGFCDQVSGSFSLPRLDLAGETSGVHRVWLKRWPVEYHTQLAVQAALQLRSDVPASDVATVEVATYDMAYHETASELAKWVPSDRETADHSLPYVMARAWLDGDITVDSYGAERISDPEVLALMSRISARIDDEIEAKYPEDLVMHVTVTSTDGSRREFRQTNPPGHHRRPLDREETDRKFLQLAGRRMDEAAAARTLARLWEIAAAPRAADVLVMDSDEVYG